MALTNRGGGRAAALLWLTVLLAASGLAAAKKVVELSPQAFANMREKSKKLLLVEFYSPGKSAVGRDAAARPHQPGST